MQIINYPFSDAKPIKGQKTIVVLDCSLLSTHSVTMPKMRSGNAKHAVIYKLEDELLQGIDELSIYVSQISADIWSAIVVAHKVLDNIKQQITQKQIDCIALVPEFMRLPVIDGKISYIQQGDLVLFRVNKFNGGKINKAVFSEFYSTDAIQEAQLGEHYQKFNFFSVSLWQKYSAQVKQFKFNAALLFFAFILSLITLGIENQQLSQHLEMQILQNKTLFQRILPDVEIVDLRVQINNKYTQIHKWQKALNQDLLLAMSKYKFDNETQRIEFDNNKLKVSK